MSGVQLVWFKRDLRVRDHAPLAEAARRGPVLALYVYEPEVLQAEDAHAAHLVFVNQCLEGLARELEARGGRLVTRRGRLPEVFDALHADVPFEAIWSHVETGNGITYARDRRVKRWCRRAGVRWVEVPGNGVVRALKSRDGWASRWEAFVRQPLVRPPERIVPAALPPPRGPAPPLLAAPASLGMRGAARPGAQAGGESRGWALLRSFLTERRGLSPRDVQPLDRW